MGEINVKGTSANQNAAAPLPQMGDIATKLQRYLAGKGLSPKKAARMVADAIDDFFAGEEDAAVSDEADDLIAELKSEGFQGKTPEEIADSLAETLDRRARQPEVLERRLRERLDARLAAEAKR